MSDGVSNPSTRVHRQHGSNSRPGRLPGSHKASRVKSKPVNTVHSIGADKPKPAKVKYTQATLDKFLAAKRIVLESAVGNLFRITMRTSSTGEGDGLRWRHSCEYRRAAWKVWPKATATATTETIIAASKLYGHVFASYDKQYIPHPATWLNDRRWEDSEVVWRATASRGGNGKPAKFHQPGANYDPNATPESTGDPTYGSMK